MPPPVPRLQLLAQRGSVVLRKVNNRQLLSVWHSMSTLGLLGSNDVEFTSFYLPSLTIRRLPSLTGSECAMMGMPLTVAMRQARPRQLQSEKLVGVSEKPRPPTPLSILYQAYCSRVVRLCERRKLSNASDFSRCVSALAVTTSAGDPSHLLRCVAATVNQAYTMVAEMTGDERIHVLDAISRVPAASRTASCRRWTRLLLSSDTVTVNARRASNTNASSLNASSKEPHNSQLAMKRPATQLTRGLQLCYKLAAFANSGLVGRSGPQNKATRRMLTSLVRAVNAGAIPKSNIPSTIVVVSKLWTVNPEVRREIMFGLLSTLSESDLKEISLNRSSMLLGAFHALQIQLETAARGLPYREWRSVKSGVALHITARTQGARTISPSWLPRRIADRLVVALLRICVDHRLECPPDFLLEAIVAAKSLVLPLQHKVAVAVLEQLVPAVPSLQLRHVGMLVRYLLTEGNKAGGLRDVAPAIVERLRELEHGTGNSTKVYRNGKLSEKVAPRGGLREVVAAFVPEARGTILTGVTVLAKTQEAFDAVKNEKSVIDIVTAALDASRASAEMQTIRNAAVLADVAEAAVRLSS